MLGMVTGMLDFDVVKVVLTRLACFWVSGKGSQIKNFGFAQFLVAWFGYYNEQSFWPCFTTPHKLKFMFPLHPKPKRKRIPQRKGVSSGFDICMAIVNKDFHGHN